MRKKTSPELAAAADLAKSMGFTVVASNPDLIVATKHGDKESLVNALEGID